MERIIIYTDGSASLKQGKGGIGFVGIAGKNKEVIEGHGHLPLATSQTAELEAVIAALGVLQTDDDRPVRVVTDSRYVINCVNDVDVLAKGWPFGKPVKNPEIIQRLHKRMRKLRKSRVIGFVWIKGHAGHEHNERADKLATKGRVETILPLVVQRR